jgi:hypothetical protein
MNSDGWHSHSLAGAAGTDRGFPGWRADGLLEEFAMDRRGPAAEAKTPYVKPGPPLLVHLTSFNASTRPFCSQDEVFAAVSALLSFSLGIRIRNRKR